MRDFDKYKRKVSYPVPPEMNCPNCSKEFKYEDKYCSDCGYYLMAWYKNAINRWNEDRIHVFDTIENKRITDFKNDCIDDAFLSNHPNADDIFWYMWNNRSCSAGFEGVYDAMISLTQLFMRGFHKEQTPKPL